MSLERTTLIGLAVGLSLWAAGCYLNKDRIDPPRCAKVKCTVTRDTVWVMGEPMPEKDLHCECLVEEQK